MIHWSTIWHDYIGISGSGALGVFVSTVVLYVFFALFMHVFGPRLLSNPTVGSFAVLAVIGGITARATLGESPTMLGALIVLSTLVLMEHLLGALRGIPRRRIPGRRPTVIMIGGAPVETALRRVHLSQEDLLDRLRTEGVLDLSQAELVILEVRGSLTIIRRGERIDEALVDMVDGRESIPAHLVAADVGAPGIGATEPEADRTDQPG